MGSDIGIEELPDGTWRAEIAPLGISRTAATQEEVVPAIMLALREHLQARGVPSLNPRVPVITEKQPDGAWKAEWAEVGISANAPTRLEAVIEFNIALQAAKDDPAVKAAMEQLPAAGPARPAREMPPELKALRSITTAEFDDVVTGDTPVLVDFWASWCGPCLMMAPALAQLQEALGDQLQVVKVDVEAETDLMKRFSITAVPTLILFRKGEEVHRIMGARGLHDLRAELEPHLA
jgi:thioredoxin 1